jgi:hypothetical protein
MAIGSNKDALAIHATQSADAWQPEKVTPFLRDRPERVPALKRAPVAAEAEQAAALPVLASAGDVREVVRLLKKRAAGITVIEGMDASRRIFDARKIAAYEYWGLVQRTGDRLSLSALGWEFAGKLELEARLYRALLDRTLAYRSALAWVFGQNLEIVTDTDIAAYWLEHPAEVFLTGNQKTIEASVTCFFHLCQEAELGMATVGKRGQPTRLRLDREELAAYVNNTHLTPHDTPAPHDAPDENAKSAQPPPKISELPPRPQAARDGGKPRVMVSRRRDAEWAKRIETILEVAGIESEQSLRAAAGASELVPDELFRALRRCGAAIIIVTGADCREDAAGEIVPEESVLMEIAAALVHYDRRVVLLWDESVPVPSRLGQLSRCSFAGAQLTWDDGLELLKALRNLQS